MGKLKKIDAGLSLGLFSSIRSMSGRIVRFLKDASV
jgi:hypothetical protein